MRKIIPWLTAVAVVTIIFGTIFAGLQHMIRLGANDPQIQLAEDAAALLDNGSNPPSIVQGASVDMAKSLAPFITVYDANGKALVSSGYLGTDIPQVPLGVLTNAQGQAYNAVTWQPTDSTRFAAVAVSAKGYYVVSARSLKEVEKRENKLLLWVTFGWLMSLAICATAYWLLAKRLIKQ